MGRILRQDAKKRTRDEYDYWEYEREKEREREERIDRERRRKKETAKENRRMSVFLNKCVEKIYVDVNVWMHGYMGNECE